MHVELEAAPNGFTCVTCPFLPLPMARELWKSRAWAQLRHYFAFVIRDKAIRIAGQSAQGS